MSFFQRSYRDYINKFKHTRNEEEKKLRDITDIPYFSSYVFDISNSSLEPVDAEYWYKKCFRKKHTYTLDVFKRDTTDSKNAQQNNFIELVGKNGWLTPIVDLPSVTDDFLTGYYFAKTFIKDKKNRPVFYYGAAKAQLLNGVIYENATLHTSTNQTTNQTTNLDVNQTTSADTNLDTSQTTSKLVWIGVDKKIKKTTNNYITSITKSNDINDNNVIRSLRNKLFERYPQKIATFICDIYPHNYKTIYNAVIFAMMDTVLDGISIIRIPDPHSWSLPQSNILMVNFLLLAVSFWQTVYIFKTPWGKKARYYIILNNPKTQFKQQHYTSLLKYTESLDTAQDNEACALFNKIFINIEDVQDAIDHFNHIKKQLIEFQENITTEEANNLFLHNLMNLS